MLKIPMLKSVLSLTWGSHTWEKRSLVWYVGEDVDRNRLYATWPSLRNMMAVVRKSYQRHDRMNIYNSHKAIGHNTNGVPAYITESRFLGMNIANTLCVLNVLIIFHSHKKHKLLRHRRSQIKTNVQFILNHARTWHRGIHSDKANILTTFVWRRCHIQPGNLYYSHYM